MVCVCTEECKCQCCRWLGILSEDDRRAELVSAYANEIERMTPEQLVQAKQKYREGYGHK